MRSVFLTALADKGFQVFHGDLEQQLSVLDSTHQRLVGLLPGLAFDCFIADRSVTVDRCDRLRVVSFGKARRHVTH